MRKSRWGVIGIGVAVAIVAAGCGSTASNASTSGTASTTKSSGQSSTASSGSSVTQVSFWESHSAANQQGHAIAQIVSEFEKANPNIRINVNITPASAKALAAVQAGDPPVMAMIGHVNQYGYERANALVNLTPLINGPSGFSKSQLKGIWPAVWKAEFTPQKKQYLFPVDVKVAEMYYNANLWKKAGLTTTPTTWAQLQQDAQVIQQKTGAIGYAARMDHNDWLALFYSNGGSYFNSQGKLTLNSPAMATTIQQIKARDNAPYVKVLSYNTSFEDFASGKLGILENTADGYEMVREDVAGKFPVGAFPVPPGTTGHSDYLYQGLSFVIFTHASAAQQQAAWKFIKYFDSPHGQAVWSVVGGEPPISQADVSAVVAMAGPKWTANPGPFAGTAVALKALQSGYVMHKIISPAQSEVNGLIQTQIQEAVQGKESIAKALANMESQGNAYLSGQAEG